MRKKQNILFILAMIFILALCLVACNKGVQDLSKLPDEVGGKGEDLVYTDAYLKFAFPEQPSSVFSAIYVKDFDVSKVHYSIVYTNGKITTEVNGGSLTEDMVVEEDRPLLSKVGHHMIRVSATLDDGKVATGSFALHLKDDSFAVERVTWKFDLGDTEGGHWANAYFGTVNQGVATVELDKGVTFTSWEQFVREFRMSLNGRALVALTYDGGKLSPTQGFENGFVANKDLTFRGEWTRDVINVGFNLNLPSDATRIDGAPDPVPTFETSKTVQRNVGKIIAPKAETFNVYNGYYFAGWYEDDGDGNLENDKLWNFSHTVGTTDISLYAKWTERAYSFTLYTMGGVFKDDATSSSHDGNTIGSAEMAESCGYKVLSTTARYSTITGNVQRLIFTGFKYGDNFDKYVAKLDIGKKNADGSIKYLFIKFTDILSNLIKGDGYVKTDGIYSNSQCTTPANVTTMVSDNEGNIDDIGYVKWVFNAPERGTFTEETYANMYYEAYSNYLVNVVFKDGISLKTDGTLCFDKVADDSINELKIPDKIKYNGVDRYVSEIGEKAAMDLKTLSTLDISEASHLTTIGNEAFSHCPALNEVVMPETNNIEKVGRNIFYKTDFENNYSKNNGGLQFIVIGKVLYNYVGAEGINPATITSLDISSDTYYTEDNCTLDQAKMDEANAQLAGVNRISAGAFEVLVNLEEIKLGDNTEYIDNYAFYGLKFFKNVIVSNNAKLSYIGEHAFEESAPIFTAESPLFVNDAVIIGNTYYRFVDRTATQTIIPANIEYIAPEAFIGCVNVAEIGFLNVKNIKEIGKDAFFSTKWIQSNDGIYVIDGFVIVNGIVAEYFGNNFNDDGADIVVPQSVIKIAPYTFNNFSQDVKTVQIHDKITKIGDYAFFGSTSLESIIFGDVAVENNRLVGAPSISDKSFLNQNDVIAFGLHLYFRKEVITLLKELSSTGNFDAIADPITRQWANFYDVNSSVFVEEDVSSVWIDKSVIATSLLQTTPDSNAFFDTYGRHVENALVVISNTGVMQKQPLDATENDMTFVLVEKDGDYSTYYEEGKTKYVVKFTYHDKEVGCALTEGDENLFVFESTKDIKGAPKFYSSQLYSGNRVDRNVQAIDGFNGDANNYWIKGFEGQVKDASLPTFYTSNTGVNLTFCYKDIDGETHELPLRILSFSTNVEKSSDRAIFAVDFNGLGEYRFSMNYSVVKSLFKEIRQSSSVSVPLNADSVKYFSTFMVELVGQDGISKPVILSSTNFRLVKVDGVPTQVVNNTVLGRHTMTVQYAKDDADGVLEKEIIYTIVLDADASMFQYEIVNERTKTAKIVSANLTVRNADTIVLPETCEINGVQYTVVEIGDNAFQGFQYLRSVYLSTTIRKIGKFAFANCQLLKNVHMVDIVGAQFIEVPLEKASTVFEEIRTVSETDTTIVKEVKVLSLKELDFGTNTSLKVRSSYTFEREGQKTLVYNVVQASESLAVGKDLNAVKVYMPDTIYNHYMMSFNSVEAEPEIYHGEFVFHEMNRLPAALMSIGNSAFNNCTSLNNIEIAECNNLEFIGVSAFANSGLESITLPNCPRLTELNSQCFENCANLMSVTMYDTVKVISIGCFNGCISLESVNTISTADGAILENTVCSETIERGAFNKCSNLSQLTLTTSVKSVGSAVFASCNGLILYCQATQSATTDWTDGWESQRPVVWDCNNNYVANDGKTVYMFVKGICYAYQVGSADKIATVVSQRSGVKNVKVEGTITGKDGLTYTVTSIDEGAFKNCYNLESVTISSNVQRIESDAFRNCTSLTTFEFEGGNGLVYISSTAFTGCSDTFVPPTVTSRDVLV